MAGNIQICITQLPLAHYFLRRMYRQVYSVLRLFYGVGDGGFYGLKLTVANAMRIAIKPAMAKMLHPMFIR